VLTSLSFLVLNKWLGLTLWPATMAAIWFGWEEPLPRMPKEIVGEVRQRKTLKDKMELGWKSRFD
jgi:hypothetical protein